MRGPATDLGEWRAGHGAADLGEWRAERGAHMRLESHRRTAVGGKGRPGGWRHLPEAAQMGKESRRVTLIPSAENSVARGDRTAAPRTRRGTKAPETPEPRTAPNPQILPTPNTV